jgi:hypothetical protein
MTTTSRIHKIGALIARLEYPMDGVALISLGIFAYREASIVLGIIWVLLLTGLLLKQAYPRPPDNDGMVMWGVYSGPWRFMAAAFLDRRAAEQWALEQSIGKMYQYEVYSRYGTVPVMVAADGKLIEQAADMSSSE